MHLYSCKVKLAGSVHNEVTKSCVTAAEVFLLRHLHRKAEDDEEDPISDVKALGREAYDDKVLRTDATERARLKSIYDPTGKKLAAVFGVGTPLPQTVDGAEGTVARRTPRAAAKAAAEAAVDSALEDAMS